MKTDQRSGPGLRRKCVDRAIETGGQPRQDDLAIGELGSYGAGQVCYRVLLCGQQGQRLLQLLLLIAGAVEGDP